MTLTANTPGQASPVELVSLTIDGFEISVPKGTLIIRAAELIGIQIPRFCDHPLLDPVGACRQCIVDVEGQRKPLTACTTTVTDGMIVHTQLSSPVAEKAQRGTMELLLINHPLDCPVCDKGGECPLQNQAMSNGQADSRFRDVKRTFPKPIKVSEQVLLDRERCILCTRCTRFSQQIAGDPFIEMLERGALQQVGTIDGEPFNSYFSGNTIQICPVGALTGAAYRFRARPFDLVSTPSVCEHCSSGCSLRTDWRRGKVTRRLAGDDPQVNEEWNCDKGRWAFKYATQGDRITQPLVRDEAGALRPASWPEALDIAARGLAAARDGAGVGVLPGGRLTVEDAYTYAKFARVALGTNDIDMRAREHSAEELAFLESSVAGRPMSVTYADIDAASSVLLAGFEAEEESPIVFLRLRKAARHRKLPVFSIAPYTTDTVRKSYATLLRAVPGTEGALLGALADRTDLDGPSTVAADALAAGGGLILVGERLATSPGALSAAARLAAATGAKLAWIPRRAGERGAVEAGALPSLLPGGRPVADGGPLAAYWGVEALPAKPGRDSTAILAAAASGGLGALVVGGVDPLDLPDPGLALDAFDQVPFLVSLEVRESSVTARADVVFPVAPAVEKAGTYLDWEGRPRPFAETLNGTGSLSDARVLDRLADELDTPLGLYDVDVLRAELESLPLYTGGRTAPVAVGAVTPVRLNGGEAILASWRMLLDEGTLQDGEPFLAATARRPVARLSPATAAVVGVAEGELLAVGTDRGTITLPLMLADLPDNVVWLPANSAGSSIHRDLGVGAGAVVRIGAGQAPAAIIPGPDVTQEASA
ncbi:MAG: NADH-quinone oxidoreductase subunit [Frankiales bacterium]|jgi:NADH-quinone oxidoreductase subunit G|nr:NADH-quinone oxidoreductase subunit [Frankiales bacterium]